MEPAPAASIIQRGVRTFQARGVLSTLRTAAAASALTRMPSATLVAITANHTRDKAVTVADLTKGYNVTRELGLDQQIASEDMRLLAITEPGEYQELKRSDYDGIFTQVKETFDASFKRYHATGMGVDANRELSKRVSEQMFKALMDVHHETFPPGTSALQEKAMKKQASYQKLKGTV